MPVGKWVRRTAESVVLTLCPPGPVAVPLPCYPPFRDVVAVTGPDRLSWLTTLSSQVLTGLTPGDGGAETLLLDAQGHITHAMAALDDGERLLLVTEAGDAEPLAVFLGSMRFMLRVEVAVLPDVVALGAMGEGIDALEATATAAGAHLGTWRDPWPGVTDGGTSYDVGLDRPHPGTGYRAGLVLVPEDHAEAVAVGTLLLELGLAGVVLLGRRQMRAAASHGLPWQAVMDAVRPQVQALWRGLPLAERRRFLRHLRPWWDVHRHRIPPRSAAPTPTRTSPPTTPKPCSN